MLRGRLFRILLLLAGTGLYFLANVQRVAIPGAIFGTLQNELGLAASWVTWLGASFMYVYAINQLVVGHLIERHGGRRVILFGALVFCVGSVLFPLSHDLFLLYLSRVLVGFGASTLYLSLVRETRRTFRDSHFPAALSLVIFTGYAGGIMAGAPFVIGATHIGWRNVLLILATASVLLWAVFALACALERESSSRGRPQGAFSLRPFFEVLAHPDNRNVCLCTGIHFGLYYVIQTVIGKKFLEDFLGFPHNKAAWILSLMAVLAALSGFLPVLLKSLLGKPVKSLIVGSISVSSTAFFLVTLMTVLDMKTAWVAALLCLISASASLSPIAIPLLYETNAVNRAGFAVCLLNFSLYFFVAVFGNAVGVLLNAFEPVVSATGLRIYGRATWLSVFCMLSFFALVALWFSLRISKKGKTDLSRSQESWGVDKGLAGGRNLPHTPRPIKNNSHEIPL